MTRVFVLLFALLLAGCELPQSEMQTKISLPEPNSQGAQLLKKFCSDCHMPPSPLVHTAKEWPNVFYRMQERRRMKGYEMFDESQKTVLLEYLEKFAKS